MRWTRLRLGASTAPATASTLARWRYHALKLSSPGRLASAPAPSSTANTAMMIFLNTRTALPSASYRPGSHPESPRWVWLTLHDTLLYRLNRDPFRAEKFDSSIDVVRITGQQH